MAVADMCPQGGQCESVTFRVRLALIGVFGRDNGRDLIKLAQLPEGEFDFWA